MSAVVSPLSGKQRRQLRALAHSLNPVVSVGHRGFTDSVLQQIDEALTSHELIKVRLSAECRVDRDQASEEIPPRLGCELAGAIGRVLTLYRPHPDKPRIRLTPADEGESP
jgi:RNA-binding protein